MRNKLFLALGTSALLMTSLAQAAPGDRLRERIKARMEERMGAQAAQGPVTPPTQTFS